MHRLLFCILVVSVAFVSDAGAQPTALVGPTAINPVDSTVIEDATILLEGGDIAAVGQSDEVTVPDGATVHEMPEA
ncbi:MAG: amidohydrolase, partial [Salinivenus sp.]